MVYGLSCDDHEDILLQSNNIEYKVEEMIHCFDALGNRRMKQ